MGAENMKIIRTTSIKMLIILVPYPAQGHVTPMVRLARSFHTHSNFQPVIIVPESIHPKLCKNDNNVVVTTDSIVYKSVPDCTSGGKQNGFFSIENMMEEEMPRHLDRIICELEKEGEGNQVVCLVVDLLASWAIQVGIRRGILVAGFWPAMLATYRLLGAIPEMVQSGFISQSGVPVKEGGVCFLPEQPLISTQDLPWMVGDVSSSKARFQFWIRTLNRSSTLNYLLVNSFSRELEACKLPTVLPVGALIMQAPVDTTPSFCQEDADCMRWLDMQKPSSVLYISFGSWVSPIGDTKIKSLAKALEGTGQPFLWVLGSAWRQGLPEEFSNRVSKQGKMVFWAPQTKVLEHKAVGCYLSHCGWNSTMEAIQFQNKLLCYPLAGDQFINCKYIVDEWKIGTRMHNLEQQDLKQGMQIIMGNNEMSTRLVELKEKFMGQNAISGAIANLHHLLTRKVYACVSNKSHLSM